MTSYVPPIKNGASGWIGYVSLAPRTPSGTWQANPTLATGDVKISLDGGALNNLGTLPVVTPAASKLVKIVLSQAETNADNLTIIFNDAAGAEWCDLTINLQTVARQIDDLAFPVTSGRGIDVDASGGVEVGSFQAGAITAAAIATGAIDADALAADAGTEIATAVWASGTRILTALDEDSTTLDLDATIRAAVGLASANLDTQLDALPTAAENADAVWDEDATAHQTGGTFGQAIGDPGADANTIYGAVVTGAAGATVAADIIAVKADTAAILDDTGTAGVVVASLANNSVSAAALAADAGTEIGTAVWATAARTLTALDEDNTTLDLDTTIRAAVGLASANLDTQLDALPTNAELATALAAADDAMLAAIAALNNITAQSVLTTQMTESYAANGAQMTLAQALYSIQQTIQMFNIDGVHKTVKRLDNVTPAFTITHNSSTAPTGAART